MVKQNITTISLSNAELDFIARFDLSPTRIVRNFIQELILREKFGSPNEELLAKIERMHQIISGYVDFIDERGLIDDFLKQNKKQRVLKFKK